MFALIRAVQEIGKYDRLSSYVLDNFDRPFRSGLEISSRKCGEMARLLPLLVLSLLLPTGAA